MKTAEALSADGVKTPPPLDVLTGSSEEDRQSLPSAGRSRRARLSAAPGRVWPRPVEQEDLEHLRRRHQTLKERRRSRWWRWVRPLLWTVAIAGLPSMAVLWLYTSPRFALRELTVVTATAAPRVSEAWVRETLAPFLDTHLLRLSLADVAAELERHQWVKTTSLSKELPERLSVRIIEHREVALLRDGDELFFLDDDGQRIAEAPGDASLRMELPIFHLSGSGPGVEAAAGLALLRELETVRSDWLVGRSGSGRLEVEVLGQGDFKLWTAALPFPLLVRAGTVQNKVRRLAELLPELSARYGAEAAIDLRFDRRIIVQPSAGGAPPGKSPPRGFAEAASGGNF